MPRLHTITYPFSFDFTKPIEFSFDGTIDSIPWLPSASHPSQDEEMNVCYINYSGTHDGVLVEIKIQPGDMFSASIPKLAQPFTYSPTDPKIKWAANLHDKGFREKKYSLNVLNTMYNDICRASGTDKIKRTLMRKGLDWFSSFAYNRGVK